MANPNTTPTPNELYNGEMKKMNDTELRIVLLVTRATLGWEIDHRTGMRKQEDWISQRQLMEKSGKSNRAVSSGVKSCIENKWIEGRDKTGNILHTPKERSGKRIFYRLGQIFLDRITSEDSSQVTSEVSSQVEKTSEVDDIKPVKQVHCTKETITKDVLPAPPSAVAGSSSSAKTPRRSFARAYPDEMPTIDAETGREVPDTSFTGKERPKVGEAMRALLEWAEKEKRQGMKFAAPKKQYSAMRRMRVAGFSALQVRERWEKMENDPYWADKGFDFTSIANDFDRKP